MCENCVYIEIIELSCYTKMFIHYNSLFIPIWIQFIDTDGKTFCYIRDLD